MLTETGKPAEALQLLDPIVKAQNVKSGPAYSRLMEAQLMAYISTNQVQQAIATMKALEQAGGGASLTQLYLKLGKLLEKELDALRQKGNTRAFAQMHQSYKTFLTTLAASKTGQTYESLEWAGESLLTLDAYKEAEEVLQRVLKEFAQDPQFLQQPSGAMSCSGPGSSWPRRCGVRASSTRPARSSRSSSRRIPGTSSRSSRRECCSKPRRRRGKGEWSAALAALGRACQEARAVKPRPADYYDAWYHVALVLSKQQETVKARQTLQGVMRLTPSVGGPEMKAKYQGLARAALQEMRA